MGFVYGSYGYMSGVVPVPAVYMALTVVLPVSVPALLLCCKQEKGMRKQV